MSNGTIIHLRKYEVEDFISVEHGTDAISITIFNGKCVVGTPGWAQHIELTGEQAQELANVLFSHIDDVLKGR